MTTWHCETWHQSAGTWFAAKRTETAESRDQAREQAALIMGVEVEAVTVQYISTLKRKEQR